MWELFNIKNGLASIVPLRSRMVGKAWFAWQADPRITKYNSHGLFPNGNKETQEFLEELDDPKPNRITWGLFVFPEDNNPKATENFCDFSKYHVGNFSLQRIDMFNRSAEFAIVIFKPEAWGKGLGTKALRHAIKHAFMQLGLHRVWTGTSVLNEGMKATASKAGMKIEGKFYHGQFLHGEFHDILCYSIFEHQYKEE